MITAELETPTILEQTIEHEPQTTPEMMTKPERITEKKKIYQPQKSFGTFKEQPTC